MVKYSLHCWSLMSEHVSALGVVFKLDLVTFGSIINSTRSETDICAHYFK